MQDCGEKGGREREGQRGGEREMEAVSLPCAPPHTQHFAKMSFHADGYARLESGLGDQRCGGCHGLHLSKPAYLITINGNDMRGPPHCRAL